MKFSTKIMGLALLSALLFSCSDATNSKSSVSEPGAVSVNIKSGKVGALARAISDQSNIDLKKLYVELSADGETTLYDTLSLSGNGATQAIKQYNDLASLKTWTLLATSVDQNDSLIHTGSINFDVIPAQVVDVQLDLEAKYSMLLAEYTPIRDSVTRLSLAIDGIEVNDSSFTTGSQASSVVLDYDYLLANAPTSHNIKMQAHGVYWGFDYLLYEGEIDIVVTPGLDTSYVVTLVWVGPAEPPVGEASMTVNLGAIGTVSIQGQLDTDPNQVISLSVGDDYQGGKIYKILQAGDVGYVNGEIHGMIASQTLGRVTYTASGSLISILNSGTYSDWRLPTYTELGEVGSLNGLGWYDYDFHWSSTSSGATSQWVMNPGTGGASLGWGTSNSVLAVRQF